MGSLGIVHSLVLEVRDRFWLQRACARRELGGGSRHARRPTVSSATSSTTSCSSTLRQQGRHAPLLVTTRTTCPSRPSSVARRRAAPPAHRARGVAARSSASCCGSLARLPVADAQQLRRARCARMRGRETTRSISYKVFNIGEANHLPAYSMELGVTLRGRPPPAAVDRILEIARRALEAAARLSTPRRSRCASWRRRRRTRR